MIEILEKLEINNIKGFESFDNFIKEHPEY